MRNVRLLLFAAPALAVLLGLALLGSGTRGAAQDPEPVTEDWVVRYDGPPSGDNQAYALAVDGAGNVYVTGYSLGLGLGGADYETVKYDASGVKQWLARYNGPGNGHDEPSALAVDGSGNIYVTGTSNGGVTAGDDYLTVKYNASGDTRQSSTASAAASSG